MPVDEQVVFDHERLDVYRIAIEFVAWTGDLLAGPLANCRLSAVSQLDRASTSIPLNIAEGNGKRSARDRCRYLDNARGSGSSAWRLWTCWSRGRPSRAS